MKRKKPTMALVTGASSGIGLEFCRQLARQGINLLMVSNQDRELIECATDINKQFGVKVTTMCQDLAVENAAAKVADFVDRQGLHIDLLINNAGIFSFAPVCETPQRKLDLFVNLHMRTVTQMCYIFGKRMAQQGYGYILNMSSMSCWMPMPGIAMYSATKAYIRAFSRALHLELRDSGVVVTVATPGGIATDLFGLPENLKKLALRLRAIDTPQHFTRGALKAVMRGRQQYINGLINRLAIVFVCSMPRSVRMLVKHKMLDKGIMKP